MAINILLVDDSAVMRRLVKKTLKLSGVPIGRIAEAGNGQEALDILEKETFDLACLDVNMPVMNGAELLKNMRKKEETKDLPVIVVSTDNSPARVAQMSALGAPVVAKPFTPETLVDAFVSAIGG